MLRVFILPAIAIALTGSAQAAPMGEWARGDGNTRVRIEPCGQSLCAINTWVKDTSKGEQVGHRLVMSVKPAGEKRMTGSAFDPQRDRTYSITINYSGASMSTRGCILAVLCKTVSWTKIR